MPLLVLLLVVAALVWWRWRTHRQGLEPGAPSRPAASRTARARPVPTPDDPPAGPTPGATRRQAPRTHAEGSQPWTPLRTQAPTWLDVPEAAVSVEEDQVWAATAEHPVSSDAVVYLRYQDATGRETRRHVTVREFGYAHPRGMFLAFCHLRQARRTFYFSRIVEASDPDTGEVLPDLHAWLCRQYDSSPDRKCGALWALQRTTLRLLLYVGRADGRFAAAERTLVRAYCRAVAPDAFVADSQIDLILRGVVTPSTAMFETLVQTLATTTPLGQRQQILAVAEAMVATQRVVHPKEQEALDYLRTRLVANPTTAAG